MIYSSNNRTWQILELPLTGLKHFFQVRSFFLFIVFIYIYKLNLTRIFRNKLPAKSRDENRMLATRLRLDLDDEYEDDDALEVDFTGRRDLKASSGPHFILNFTHIYLLS